MFFCHRGLCLWYTVADIVDLGLYVSGNVTVRKIAGLFWDARLSGQGGDYA